jgi:2-oxoglutarate dehydrogenase E2 component (dihydrolipoamide succinyltransferase)
MPVDVRIPPLGESVSEGVIVRWIKSDGDPVATDEPLFELETDKASVEIPAPGAGVIRILEREGATVQVGDVVARIEEGAGRTALDETPRRREEARATADSKAAEKTAASTGPPAEKMAPAPATARLSPSVRRLVEEHGLDPRDIEGTGRGGRLTKPDVLAHLDEAREKRPAEPKPATPQAEEERPRSVAAAEDGERRRVPMTRLRQRIAERLRQAQRTAAILTTFNEIDMSAVIDLRGRYKKRFAEVHGVALGFMSFFARACVAAIRDLPVVNAQIDGTDVVYSERVHLGIAVGTERGLVVPILHGADRMSFAEIERHIERLAGLARESKLGIEDLSGGTFTISNGGVYGSLLSTPILNPPQSAILGMHKIERRPVVVDDQIVVRPMMYVALSYDHRLIDGAEAVTFLVRVKERLEEPSRLLFDL